MKINEWLSIDKMRGERGTTTVSLTTSVNTDTISRNSTLVVDNVSLAKFLIAEQRGKAINITVNLPYIILDNIIPNPVEITITTNDRWELTLPEGFEASQTSGEGTTTISINSTKSNFGYDEINGYLTIRTDTEVLDVPIIQLAYTRYNREEEFGFTCDDENGCFIKSHNVVQTGYDTYTYGPTIGQFQYSKDGQSYQLLDDGVTLSKGETILVKGSLTSSYSPQTSHSGSDEFVVNGKTKCFGDVRWLYVLGTHNNRMMFPALFYECDITTPPKLPMREVKERSYVSMFAGCKYLKEAPELPALKMEHSCYMAMFFGCTSLTIAPQLPAMILEGNCYDSMFYGCSNLIEAPALPALKLKVECYFSMFRECEALTKAPDLMAPTAVSNIFSPDNCMDCYTNMFVDCKNLNYIKCATLPIGRYNPTAGGGPDISSSWLAGVSATGTFIGRSGHSYKRETSEVPQGWTLIQEL